MRKVLLTALFIAMCTMAMAKKNLRDKIDFTQKYFDITWAFPEDFKAEEWYRGEEIYSTWYLPKVDLALEMYIGWAPCRPTGTAGCYIKAL